MQGNGSTPGDFAGVVAALREKGFDPGKVISCAPSAGLPGSVPGVRGCNVYDRCPFSFTRYGGFKGKGPKNVGYYLKTNDGSTHQKEDEIACYKFVSLLLERMRAGIRDREQGRSGNPGPELINIVAQEGELIRTKVWKPVNEADKSYNAPYHHVVETRAVSVYRHPADLAGDSYESTIERAAEARIMENPDFQSGPPVMPATTVRLMDDDDDDLGLARVQGAEGAVPIAAPMLPIAEPVRKGK